jgi:hypothetical protein
MDEKRSRLVGRIASVVSRPGGEIIERLLEE